MTHHHGALRLAVAFEVTEPWTVLFGPSGSGKSTVLRAIAGLMRPDQARVAVQLQAPAGRTQQVLTNTWRGVFLAPHLRPVRWSAQGSALFPHLTVRENVGYGAPGRRAVVDEAMARLRLNGLANKRSGELSGGERQRVTLARAIAAAMAGEYLLLLDEPFVGLDLKLRDELLADLLEWRTLSGTRVLSVTHDIGEAFLLGAEVIRIHDGKVVGQGRASQVLGEERERLVRQLSEVADKDRELFRSTGGTNAEGSMQ